jgi:hypothetical protein
MDAFNKAFNQTGQTVGLERQKTPETSQEAARKAAIKVGGDSASFYASLNIMETEM